MLRVTPEARARLGWDATEHRTRLASAGYTDDDAQLAVSTPRQIAKNRNAPPDARLRASSELARMGGLYAPQPVATKVIDKRVTYRLDLGALLGRVGEVLEITAERGQDGDSAPQPREITS